MRVAQVLASIDDPTAGPSHSVSMLCRSLNEIGVSTPIHTVLGWRSPGGPLPDAPPAQRHPQDFAGIPVLGRLCLSRTMKASLQSDAAALDVIHAHGLWLMPNVYPGARSLRRRPLMVSPRGMLGPAALNFSKGRKAAFWWLLQRRVVDGAACLHATGNSELDEIRAFGIERPVAVIPNGVAMPAERPATSDADAPRTVLALGRIHPKKGLDRLLHAWARVEAAAPGWRLRIVGPDEEGHLSELKRLSSSLALKRVSFAGPATGPGRTLEYQAADVFVLPTLNENFALTVAEALAAGTCVIATKGAPWSGLEERRCGWWIDHGVEPLAAALLDALARPADELRSMGARGRAWMAADFTWEAAASQMAEAYRWVAGRGDRPPWVRS